MSDKIPLVDLISNGEENKSFCSYPFHHSYVDTDSTRALCCVAKDLVNPNIKYQSTEDWWNGDYMRDVRIKMLKGEKIPDCEYCYYQEEVVGSSVRTTSIESLEPDKIVPATIAQDGYLDTMPSTYDYRTIHCNLSCRTCGPTYSTTYLNLYDKMGVSVKNFIDIDTASPEYVAFENAMISEMKKALDVNHIDWIYWAGGEPFMSTVHWQVMGHIKELVKENPDYEMTIRYNSNINRKTWKNENIYEYLSELQEKNIIVSMSPSIDGIGSTYNYVRRHGDWNIVKENWEKIIQLLRKDNIKGENKPSATTVITAPLIMTLDSYLDYFEQFKEDGCFILPMKYMRTKPNERHMRTGGEIWLDPCSYPKDIILSFIDKAIKRAEASSLWGKDTLIKILEAEKKDVEEYSHMVTDEILSKYKTWNLFVEHHSPESGITISEFLKETDTELWMWYNSIPYKDYDEFLPIIQRINNNV